MLNLSRRLLLGNTVNVSPANTDRSTTGNTNHCAVGERLLENAFRFDVFGNI